MLQIDASIEALPKVGPVFAKRFKQLGIETVKDLLWHFPQRYEDFSVILPIAKAKLNQKACFCGKITAIETNRTWKKKILLTEAVLQDKTSAIKIVWYNQPYLSRSLKENDEICVAGKVAFDKNGLYLASPTYEKIFASENLTHTGRIIPIYPEIRGVSSRYLRFLIKIALQEIPPLQEAIPQNISKKENFLEINQAIRQIHFPDSFEKLSRAKERFAFENIFLIELAVLKQKLKVQKQKAPNIPLNVEVIKELVAKLPFNLTDSQRKCVWQIAKDLEKPRPMSRLLEGDVGSGKTVVAVLAMLCCVKAGFQAAFMAPTEILAQQHFNEVSKLLQPFKIKIALLTGKKDKIISQKLGYKTAKGFAPETMEISRAKILEKTLNKEIDLLIGTHALIQDKVKFGNLALVVVDEQHRFGVKQRAHLIQKSKGAKQVVLIPHFLSMTATPIPRTLALTLYGDLDLSLLDELPKGRKKIITQVVPSNQRQSTYDFIAKEIKNEHQVFVICPRIEKPEEQTENKGSWDEVKAVEEEYEKLSKKIFPKFRVKMLHGKMKSNEKEKIMKDFKNQKADILVATSVVEVGLDIPNATVMMIEGSDRFGLAQLHQFRGRVGRAKKQSYCFLLTDSKSLKTRSRLKAMLSAKNGFELAQKDLEIRGPGCLAGIKQWGIPDITMDALKNLKLVEKTRELAKQTLIESPCLAKYPFLQKGVEKFEKIVHLE